MELGGLAVAGLRSWLGCGWLGCPPGGDPMGGGGRHATNSHPVGDTIWERGMGVNLHATLIVDLESCMHQVGSRKRNITISSGTQIAQNQLHAVCAKAIPTCDCTRFAQVPSLCHSLSTSSSPLDRLSISPMPFEFDFANCIEVAGAHMKHPIYIPAKDIKVPPQGKFIHVSNVAKHCIQLFAGEWEQGQRPMSKTDIICELTRRRNEIIDGILDDAISLKSEALSVFASFDKKTKNRNYTHKKKTVTVPDTIEVVCPDLPGGLNGHRMIVIGTLNRNAPLYVEMTSCNLAYLKAFVEYQRREGATKRRKVRKIKPEGSTKRRKIAKNKPDESIEVVAELAADIAGDIVAEVVNDNEEEAADIENGMDKEDDIDNEEEAADIENGMDKEGDIDSEEEAADIENGMVKEDDIDIEHAGGAGIANGADEEDFGMNVSANQAPPRVRDLTYYFRASS